MTGLGGELGNFVAAVSPCEINDTSPASVRKITVSVELPAVLERTTAGVKNGLLRFLATRSDAFDMLKFDSVMSPGSAPGRQPARMDPLQDRVSRNRQDVRSLSGA
jgi:hypothetical protein